MTRVLTLLALFALVACSGPDDREPKPPTDMGSDGGPDADMGGPDTGPSMPGHLFSLAEVQQFDDLKSAAREVKFLARAPGGDLPGPLKGKPVVFSDTTRFPLHLQFLRSLEGLEEYSGAEYNSATRHRGSRTYIPGSLYGFPKTPHPAGGMGVIAYTFAVMTQEMPADVDAYAAYDQMLGEHVTFPAQDIVLIAATPEQESWLVERESALREAGVTFMRQADLQRPSMEVYSPAESYGYLKVLKPGKTIKDYGPRDIIVADAAHDDISLLSGLITIFPQSDGSHLNLRLREKRLPNMKWAGAREDTRVQELDGRLVHLVVRVSDETPEVELKQATLEDAKRFWDMQQPPLGAPGADLDVVELTDFASLKHAGAEAFGVKAANLGELHAALPEENRATGFGIPFSYYVAHLKHNDLESEVTSLVNNQELLKDREALGDALKALRRSIRRGELAPNVMSDLTARVDEVFGPTGRTTFLRFRSSTNAEDLRAFSGAGLYDSKTGCLADDLDGDDVGPSRCWSDEDLAEIRRRITAYEARLAADPSQTWLQDEIDDFKDDLVEEKPVSDALRKVWRSLWNLRAFDERAYYGIPHTSAYMGVAVMPSFVFETREAVVLTNLSSEQGKGLYQVFSQIDDIGVVRPKNPHARPEELRFFEGEEGPRDFQVIRRSTESPDQDLWSESRRQVLGGLLITVQKHFASVYSDIDPLHLDIELEVTRDDRIVIKQARPYLGAP